MKHIVNLIKSLNVLKRLKKIPIKIISPFQFFQFYFKVLLYKRRSVILF